MVVAASRGRVPDACFIACWGLAMNCGTRGQRSQGCKHAGHRVSGRCVIGVICGGEELFVNMVLVVLSIMT